MIPNISLDADYRNRNFTMEKSKDPFHTEGYTAGMYSYGEDSSFVTHPECLKCTNNEYGCKNCSKT